MAAGASGGRERSAIEVVMPALGQSVAEGTLVEWLKRAGDSVKADESLAAVETDKAETEIPSPADGVLKEILVEAGSTVDVGTVLARLEVERGATPAPQAAPAAAAGSARAEPEPAPRAAAAPPGGRVRPARFLSPAVRKLLRSRGLRPETVAGVAGTGRGGRLTLADLERHLDSGEAPDVEVIPLTGMRRRIADHLTAAARDVPHVNTVAEADMSAVSAARAAHRDAFAARHGFSLSYNAFFLRASARALAAFPQVNAIFDERGIVAHRSVHLGMAVALEPSGLVVPVIRHAERLSVRELAVAAHRLGERARARQLTADEMAGGTCTVTNPGVFGNLFGTPIIHVPQAAIVDFGAIRKRVVVTDHDAIAIRPMAHVVVAWDHRVMDGATAARFLQRLVRELEGMPTDGIDER